MVGSSLIRKKRKLAKITTRCHSLSCVSLVVICCYHSLSFVVIRCHSLSLVATRCTTRCHSLCHSLSVIVTRCHSLSLDISLVCRFTNDLINDLINVEVVRKSCLRLILICRFSSCQKQPPRGVLRKRCAENMQRIYRRSSMPKCNFNYFATSLISHFGMGVLLKIYYIFSEHLLLRTPLEGCFCLVYRLKNVDLERSRYHSNTARLKSNTEQKKQPEAFCKRMCS